jgi:hypothetical protein
MRCRQRIGVDGLARGIFPLQLEAKDQDNPRAER